MCESKDPWEEFLETRLEILSRPKVPLATTEVLLLISLAILKTTPELLPSYCQATPELLLSYTPATPELLLNYSQVTSKLFPGYSQATLELLQSYS